MSTVIEIDLFFAHDFIQDSVEYIQMYKIADGAQAEMILETLDQDHH